jgi:hypothetical protein
MLRGCQLSHAYRQLLLSSKLTVQTHHCREKVFALHVMSFSCRFSCRFSFQYSCRGSCSYRRPICRMLCRSRGVLAMPCLALPAAARARHGALKAQKQIDLPIICLDRLTDVGNVEVMHDGVNGDVPAGGRGPQGSLLFAELRVHRLEAVDGLWRLNSGQWASLRWTQTHTYA